MNEPIKVHFMGICGSGAAPIAIIAKNMGFNVSGCDLNAANYYSDMLINNGIEVLKDHNLNHLDNIDILAISPAILDISPNHPEVIEAKKRGILITWQEFSSRYIQNEKFVISIAGTHGKSTTTTLMGLVLENGGLDPLVEVGSTFKSWGGGYRLGKSNYFVCEADEFNNNFLNYSSSIAIINNVEMDHPEFFKDLEAVKDSFKAFIKKLTGPKILIVNEESIALREVLIELKDWLIKEKVKIIGYYIDNRFNFPFHIEYNAVLTASTAESSCYEIITANMQYNLKLGIIGRHNVENSLGVFIAALELGVPIDRIKESFESFKGIGRRLELIGDIDEIKIFDDFAHHPTAIASTLDSIKLSYPKSKIFAIFEPHQISRVELFFDEFILALKKADKVIITKPFLGREINKNINKINFESLATQINIKTSKYIEDYDTICNMIANEVSTKDIIVVFGASESYKLSRKILNRLNEKRRIQ